MTREELAAQIFCSLIKSGKDEIDCEDCFSYADQFLAYAAKQREPKACEHIWINPLGLGYHCGECGAPKVNPEPSKPEPEVCGHLKTIAWFSEDKVLVLRKCYDCGVKLTPEPPKPECEHKFATKIGNFEREWIHCLKCGEPKPEPPNPCPNEGKRLCSHRPEDHEPPKPERKAREFWLGPDGCKGLLGASVGRNEVILVREVLND